MVYKFFIYMYGIRGDKISLHVISAVQIAFWLKKFKHFLGGNNETIV